MMNHDFKNNFYLEKDDVIEKYKRRFERLNNVLNDKNSDDEQMMLQWNQKIYTNFIIYEYIRMFISKITERFTNLCTLFK
jgi:hypothetical protein